MKNHSLLDSGFDFSAPNQYQQIYDICFGVEIVEMECRAQYSFQFSKKAQIPIVPMISLSAEIPELVSSLCLNPIWLPIN